MSNVTAIVFRNYGVPHEAAQVEEISLPPVGNGEVRLRLLAAPINPADLNTIEGRYPTGKELPGQPGVEGLAEVVEAGASVAHLQAGDRVLFPHGLGSWREAAVTSAENLFPIPKEIPIEQAAMLRINPATALRMLRDFGPLQPGDWVLQNLSNSGVGRSVIQIAKACGWRTINVVRGEHLVNGLKAIGADEVLVEGDGLTDQIKSITGDKPAQLALNGVGGESALRLANALAPGGTVVTYGAMGRQPLRIPNGLLIFQDLSWRGFWVSRWYRDATFEARAAMFRELFDLAARGILHTPVERIYPLTEVRAALEHAARPRREGKILFGAPEICAAFQADPAK